MASRVFRFEADFAGDLRCLPMAVRRKLDLAGVKLKLVHWHGLQPEERQRLLDWPDGPGPIQALRLWLLERSRQLPQGPASTLPIADDPPWRGPTPPAELRVAAAPLGLELSSEAWAQLPDLQRCALLKLSRPGHEHRNLPAALREFGLLPG